MISTGTDGASVMMGGIGGVVSLIKQDAPQVIEIHCVAHNLELAFSDTLKSNEGHSVLSLHIVQFLKNAFLI